MTPKMYIYTYKISEIHICFGHMSHFITQTSSAARFLCVCACFVNYYSPTFNEPGKCVCFFKSVILQPFHEHGNII